MKKIYEKPEIRLTLTQVKDTILRVSGDQASVYGNDNVIDDPFDFGNL